jgi:exodeoxyribonuclease VII large subunit
MNAPFMFLSPQQAEKPYSVSDINKGCAIILESGNTLVWVEGELSNFKCASSGHCYLRLKDEQSLIPAVIWRASASQLEFEPRDGMLVRVIASLRVYQKGGYYQLDIHRMQPAGIGALFAAFEKLKGKLDKEGLFDPAHKKALPRTVSVLGVITSKTGAAIHDIIKVAAHRAPSTNIVLYDVAVQGEKAPGQIIEAIRVMNAWGKADCLIVGRGGGSVEDLQAFNDEGVARAIYASDIPVISAVGHEIDFSIADFVADMRAPTPSAAAEMAVADQQAGSRLLAALALRFSGLVRHHFSAARRAYEDLALRFAGRSPTRMIAEARQHCDELFERQILAMTNRLRLSRERLRRSAAQLDALSPLAVLSRGYSVVLTTRGTAVKDAAQVAAGEKISMRFYKGGALAEIIKVMP